MPTGSMTTTEAGLERAERRMQAKAAARAVSVRYDRRNGLVLVVLETGLQIGFPPRMAQGLAGATPAQLSAIEITPSGLGLHWPKLDADLYMPGLLRGVLGSAQWMAAGLGASGGRARSEAKATSARENGRKGGRPRKAA